MIIGIDARPLKYGKAGIGFSLENILCRLILEDKNITYVLYSNRDFDLPINKELYRKHIYRSPIGNVGYLLLLPFILKKHKVNIFWGTQNLLPLFISGIKSILTVQDLCFIKFPRTVSFYNYVFYKLFFRKSVFRADKIIAISATTKKDLTNIYKIKKGEIEVFYPIVKSYSGHTVTPINKSIKTILYLGTIEPRKNLINLINGFLYFTDKYKANNYQLVIGGKIGWKCKEELKLIRQHSDKIQYFGYISEDMKKKMYNEADLFIFPSLYEGFGMPVLEALSCGLTVIVSDIPIFKELFSDACMFVNHLDYKAIGESIFMFENESSMMLSAKHNAKNRFAYFQQIYDKQSKNMLKFILG